MSANYDLERRIADHYAAEAPLRAPDWVLDQILASVDATPQRRTVPGWPWRFLTMPFSAKLALTAASILAVGLVALPLLQETAVGPPASPSPTASPSPLTPPPLTERFDSTLNGISMSYPAGWQTRPATESWDRSTFTFDATDVDVIFDPMLKGDLFLAVVSESLNGQPPSDWCCSPPRPEGPDICAEGGGGGHTGGTYRLDGAEEGFASTTGCGRGGGSHSVIAATTTRGYIMTLYFMDDRLVEPYDWDWFKTLLETVELRPVDAP